MGYRPGSARSKRELDQKTPKTVRVDRNRSGAWEIELSAQDAVVSCETLDDARWVAYLCASRRHPCELVVRDAYHRVLCRELIDADCSEQPGTTEHIQPPRLATRLMRQPATIDGPDRVDRRTEAERELAQALALLQNNNVRPVTAAALRNCWVTAPAQAV